MNYIAELNALYHFMLRKKMPKSEFALLTVLYMINNAEDWELWFEADNELLQRLTGGYSREALNHARNGLKQKGRIDFRPGKRNEEAAKYRIIPFGEESDIKLDMKVDMKLDKEVDVKLDTKTKHKQNKTILTPISPLERFEFFWACYPLDKNRAAAERAYCDVVASGIYTEDDLVEAAKNYAEYCKLTGADKIYHANNFLGKAAFEDYLPGKYKKPEPKADKNKFNQFEQNDYDFEELERSLSGK